MEVIVSDQENQSCREVTIPLDEIPLTFPSLPLTLTEVKAESREDYTSSCDTNIVCICRTTGRKEPLYRLEGLTGDVPSPRGHVTEEVG